MMSIWHADDEDASHGEESDTDERSEEGAKAESSDHDSGADQPGALPKGLPDHVAVAAGGRVRRRAVFPDSAATAGATAPVDADSDDEGEAGEAYEDPAAQRSGGDAGPSGRGLGDSGSEDSEGALPWRLPRHMLAR